MLTHGSLAAFLPDKMDSLKNNKCQTSRRTSRRTGRHSNVASLPANGSPLPNNSEPSVEAATYKSVLSSRPPTAAGSDVPVDGRGSEDRGADSYTSLLFSEHAWNPHEALLQLPSLSKTVQEPMSAPTLDVDDDAFFSTLFDEVLNDAEQFTAGVGTVNVDPDIQSPFVPTFGQELEPFEIQNVMYVSSPELRDLVRRYPASAKQELDANDVVQMTNATMTQVRAKCPAHARAR